MSDQTALIPQSSIDLVVRALAFCESVQIVEIKSNDQAENANQFFRELNGYIKTLDEERERVKKPHLDAGRLIDSFFKEKSAALLNLKTKLDTAIRAYKTMLEQRRREEQEKLNRIAEQQRREAEEKARIQREKEQAALMAQQEALRRARDAQDEEARQTALAQAAKAQKTAEAAAERAAQRESMAETIFAPIAQTIAPNFSGTTARQNWKVEITDHETFIRWASAEQRWHLLQPNQSACNAWAKSARKEMQIPGARIFNDEKLVGRAV